MFWLVCVLATWHSPFASRHPPLIQLSERVVSPFSPNLYLLVWIQLSGRPYANTTRDCSKLRIPPFTHSRPAHPKNDEQVGYAYSGACRGSGMNWAQYLWGSRWGGFISFTISKAPYALMRQIEDSGSGGNRFSFPPSPKIFGLPAKRFPPPRRARLQYWDETMPPPPGPPAPP